MMVLKELPEEVWSMIAQRLKREPPAAGAKANWNDHFHQQDLVNLQRVSKTIYSVVSPILYHSPIVQNLGLFLEGIQHVYDKNNESTPFHKLALLQQVRKLHLIYASSNVPVDEIYMRLRGLEMTGSEEGTTQAQCGFVADRLGTADIDGFTIAHGLLELHRLTNHSISEKQSTFRNLEAISFGTWDDGRWRVYAKRKSKYPDDGLPNAPIYSSEYSTDILFEFMDSFEMPRSFAICNPAPAGHGDYITRPRFLKRHKGLIVMHNANGNRLNFFLLEYGHYRAYIKTNESTDYSHSSSLYDGLQYIMPDPADEPEPRGPRIRRQRKAAGKDDSD